MVNGLAAFASSSHGATFMVFSDHERLGARVCASGYIFGSGPTTASFWRDCPMHEPIEHLASLRAMLNLSVIRPAEQPRPHYGVAAAIQNTDRPTALPRQKAPSLDLDDPASGCAPLGAYVVQDAPGGHGRDRDCHGHRCGSLRRSENAGWRDGPSGEMPSWDLSEQQPKDTETASFRPVSRSAWLWRPPAVRVGAPARTA